MTILFAAGELESFTNATGTNVTAVTTADRFDADFARSAISVTGQAFVQADFTAGTEGWLHLELYLETIDTTGDFDTVALVDSSTGNPVMTLNGNNGNLALEYNNGAGFTRVELSNPIGGDSLVTIDMHWIIADVSGEFTVYVNGIEEATFSGDTLQTGFTTIDQLVLSGGDNATSGSPQVYFSQIIVADEDTRGWKLAEIDPTGASATNTAWTGDHLDVDNIGIDDGTLIDSNAIDEVETFTCSDLSAAGAALDVIALIVGFRAQKGSTGPQNLQGAIRTNSLNFFSSSVSGLATSAFNPFQAIWETNPDTAVAWTPTEIDAIEIGVKSIT